MADEQLLPDEPIVEEPISDVPDNGDQEEAKTEPQYLDQTAFEAKWAEREAALEERFNAKLAESQRQAQRKADSARDNAVRKQKTLLDEYVPILKAAGVEINDDNLRAASEQIRNKEFWQDSAPVINPPPNYGQANVTTLESLQGYLKSRGLKPDAMNLAEYVGVPDSDTTKGVKFYAQVNDLLVQAQTAARTQAQAQKQQQAQKVIDVKNNIGGTATPPSAAGGNASATALQDEMAKLLKTSTGDQLERQANRNRIDEIAKELQSQGIWGK